MQNINLALLFWFYKEPEICENHLNFLKKYNPNLKIFGLYGGEKAKSKKYKNCLNKYLDDFYVSPFQNANWKWKNGDLMILDWYVKRGKYLNWDSIAVIQWDALVFDSLINQFPDIKKNEIFLAGLKIIDESAENQWYWTRPGSRERSNYLAFHKYVKNNYNYNGHLFQCLFILQIFPRIFFEKYLKIKNSQLGFLEYKIPTYAKIFKIPFYEKDMGVRWFDKRDRPLNAVPEEINQTYIKNELCKNNGWRIFHPYYKIWK